MPETPTRELTSPSRRAMLAGAIGGLGALVASAIRQPQRALGHDSQDVLLGGQNNETTTTIIENGANSTTVLEVVSATGTAMSASSTSGAAVDGSSGNSVAINGFSNTSYGVYGSSNSLTGIGATSGASIYPALRSQSTGGSTAVVAYSGDGVLVSYPAKTGVWGYAAQDSAARGVIGQTTAGHGIHGIATTGYAGYFDGKVYTTKFHEMKEISAPTAPAANRGRLFLRDNGGKTQLCIRFSSGAIQVISTQP